MREHINILKYGFLLFLIVVGVISIFCQDVNFINCINNLALPIFAFSISILLVKTNQYIQNELSNKIKFQNNIVKESNNNIFRQEKQLEQQIDTEITYKKKVELQNQLNCLYEKSLISSKELIFYYKFFNKIDTLTQIFNTITMLSLVWCLVSLLGFFTIQTNFAWVNIFSLALVFFDFFIFDDFIKKSFNKKIERITGKVAKSVSQDIQSNKK